LPIRAHLADGLSLANGACGVGGILLLLTWSDPRALPAACVLVFAGWGFDSVDGLAARGLGRPRAVGEVMDSLCDTSSFGVLPAILLAMYGHTLGSRALAVGVLIGIVFYGCVVLRLRRYTVHAVADAPSPRTFFSGLPSPVAAMTVAAAILAARAADPALAWIPFVFAAACAPLMISTIPFKDLPRLSAWLARAIWPLPVLAAIAWMGSAAIAVLAFFAAYLTSGALRLHAPARATRER
jgi:phosphatidylserine synthase